jgi:hypothetical protein
MFGSGEAVRKTINLAVPALTLRSTPTRATIGHMRWHGPDGTTVEVVSITRGGYTRDYYRLRQWGTWTADCASLDELARHVDLAQLVEQPEP